VPAAPATVGGDATQQERGGGEAGRQAHGTAERRVRRGRALFSAGAASATHGRAGPSPQPVLRRFSSCCCGSALGGWAMRRRRGGGGLIPGRDVCVWTTGRAVVVVDAGRGRGWPLQLLLGARAVRVGARRWPGGP
jgi:hypothetical protein